MTVAGLVAVATVIGAAPANAAPGDASAVGASAVLVLDLPPIALDVNSSVGGVAVTNPGTASSSEDDYTLFNVALADATLAAVSTNASSDDAGSAASATVEGAEVNLFGISLLTADTASATVTCTLGAAPTAEANVTGLTVLGDAATIDVGDADLVTSVPLGADVGGVDLTGVNLIVTVSQQEDVVGDTAAATAVIATVRLEGTLAGEPYAQALGVVTLASAACETPAVAPITATGITPAVGPTAGGQTVTITGSGFTPDTTVSFGGNPATAVTVDPSGTSLTAVTPPGAAGPTTVTVTNPDGSATLDYTYVAPAVTSLTPTSGPEAGGTVVTISGQGLDTTTDVTFGGVPATIQSVSPDGTQVVVTSPPGTGTVDVVLTLDEDTEVTLDDSFTYIAAAVTDLTPSTGPAAGGTTVTITGSGLADTTDVLFDGVAGTITGTPTDTQIVVVTPPGVVGPVDVSVELPGGSIVVPDGFVYVAGPAATSATPDQGPAAGGTVVDVTGTGFVPGQTTVTICGIVIPIAQVAVDPSGTSLSFTTPACDPGATTIVITTPAGATDPLAFRYIASSTGGGGGSGNLANTGGTSPAPALAAAVALLALGAALIGIRRRWA